MVQETQINFQDLARGTAAIHRLADLMSAPREKKKKGEHQDKLNTLRELTDLSIDPRVFDAMLSSELDRRLKRKFGIAFLILAIAFAITGYAIVIANSLIDLGISDSAITALIIQIPVQLVGLLYIIARNLFPRNASTLPHQRLVQTADSNEDHQP